MCNKMDYNPLKKRVFAISILNILLTITLSVGGLYLLMPVIMHFQPNWKVIYCGYYKTSLVANIIVTILIALIGVILSVYLLLVIGTKALENYTLIPYFFNKSIEIGGCVFCDICLVIFPHALGSDAETKEDCVVRVSSLLIALIITTKMLLDIYLVMQVVTLDEKFRKQWWTNQVRKSKRIKKRNV